jgi:acyl dehydratase
MQDDVLYFDDLQVGDTFSTRSFELTEADLLRFAGEFDPQPFHLDDEAARGTLFGGLAASGWHTAAITMRLLVTSGPRLANGIIGMGGDIEWKSPARPGDVLRVDSEVTDLVASRSRADRGMLVLRSTTRNQRDETVQVTTAKLMLARRQLATSAEDARTTGT